MKKFLYLLVMLCVTMMSYAQITPVNIGTSPNDKTGDPLRTAFDKLNKNDAYLDTFGVQRLDSLITQSPAGVGMAIDDQYPNKFGPVKANNDIKGPGKVIVTNGSATVSGIGTTFTDAGRVGLSYWFSFHVKDSIGNWYLVFLSTVTNDSTATIQRVYSDALLGSPNANPPTTFPGVSGTYDYWIVKNKSAGDFAVTLGNNNFASDYAVALGGLATASGQASYAWGNQVLSTGARSFAGGWGSFSAGTANDKRVLASGQTAFNWSTNFSTQTPGHGALANQSAILGGRDHNIPSDAVNSVVIGGNAIKVGSGILNTVHMPKIRFGLGTSGGVVTDNTNTNILARDATTGEIEIRDASTLGGTVTASNGLIKVGNDIQLGGSIVSPTTLDIGQFTDNKFSVTAGPIAGAQGFLFDIVGDSFDGGRFLLRSTGSLSTKFAGVNAQLGVAKIEGSNAVGNFSLAMDGENATAKFIDNRNVKLGLQYDAAGYETTDLTLISRGFANSNYWKTSGTTTIPNTSNVDIDLSQFATGANGFNLGIGDGAGFTRAGGAIWFGIGSGDGLNLSYIHSGLGGETSMVVANNGVTLAVGGGSNQGFVYSNEPDYSNGTTLTSVNYVQGRTLEGSLSLDFPSTNATSVSEKGITVLGAEPGDVCSLGVPPASMTATATYTCYVFSADLVVVRFSPKAVEDPAPGTFKVIVHKP